MKPLTVEQAAKDALRGEKIMIGVYGEGVGGPVDITIAFDRKDGAEYIREFREHFPERDPVGMARMALRTMMLMPGGIPPHAEWCVIGPALLLAKNTPHGIDGVFAIEITVREEDVLVEVYDLDGCETSKTAH